MSVEITILPLRGHFGKIQIEAPLAYIYVKKKKQKKRKG
jgi:hypothetical protein